MLDMGAASHMPSAATDRKMGALASSDLLG
jgi:hypothetical protein